MEEFSLSSPESSDASTAGVEKSREQSEKQRESYKKAQAQIQKSQKDEKKATWDNENLFHILERFIQNPYYERLIPLVTELLKKSVPARYILTLIALFYPEATIHLLTAIHKNDDIKLLLSLHREETLTEFHEKQLHPSIRIWMSYWVQAGRVYLTQTDMSILQQKKLSFMMKEDIFLTNALADGLEFFFTSRNLLVAKHTMFQYARHIISEYCEALDQIIAGGDPELLEEISMDQHSLFGLSIHN